MSHVMKLALELGPLVVFFGTNTLWGIFDATIAFMVATTVALATSYAINRSIPVMPLVTGIFVLTFGALTIWLQNETFIKLKPTIVNLMFATILTVGLATGRIFLKLLFESAFNLTETGWRLLTRAWIGFFLTLAVLNEIVWRSYSTDTWVAFKVFGIMPLTLLFSLSLLPIIMKHAVETVESGENSRDKG